MSLHIKLTLLVVVLAIVTGGTVALLMSHVMHNTLEQELEKRGVVIARTMAEHVTHSVIDGEVVAAREALQEIVQQMENVEFAYITGFDGKVFAHSFEDGFPRDLLPDEDEDEHELIRADAPHLERYSTKEGLGLLVGYPLIDGMKAHLHIGLNETHLHGQVERTRNQIVSATFMVALVAASFGILLSRSIARPLEQLSASLRAFGEGRVEQELDFRGGGREVADLTRSFNQMITARVWAEEALRRGRDNLVRVFEAMEDGVYVVDQEYDIQYVNPVLVKDFGPYQGRKCYAYFHDREEACPWCKDQDVFAGKTVRWEWYSFKNQRTYDLIGAPLRNADGSMSKLEIFRDITERLSAEQAGKRAEEALREYSERLEEMVTERTAELNERVAEVEQLNRGMTNLLQDLQAANRNLEETAGKLEAANEELEAFAYSVSHDLRAPLRHIDGFVQLLLKRERERLDPTSSRYLNVIAESSDKMRQLIDDLLAFSRTGRAEMQTRRVELNELVRAVQQELDPMLEGRQITWEIGPLPAVQADPTLLRQVWVNLLSNACKFTAPRSKARIEIGVKKPGFSEKSGFSEVTIFVRDNGVGFDPQYRHKLFGVFQRLHREGEFEGTGIGLAIVRRIIHRHGGQVWAEGELDGGATFYFTLREAKGE